MLKKPITFTDYFGEERTIDFYFNLTQSEIMEMEFNAGGNFERIMDKIIQTKDMKKLWSYFKEIILKAHGIKSDDGLRFIKGEEVSKAFEECPAFDILITELVSDADKAAAFMNAVVPKEMSNKATEKNANMNPALASIQGKNIPPAIPTNSTNN